MNLFKRKRKEDRRLKFSGFSHLHFMLLFCEVWKYEKLKTKFNFTKQKDIILKKYIHSKHKDMFIRFIQFEKRFQDDIFNFENHLI